MAVWLLAADEDGEGSTGFLPDHLDALKKLNQSCAGQRTFVAVDALLESGYYPTVHPAQQAPLLPVPRQIDLATRTYLEEPRLSLGD